MSHPFRKAEFVRAITRVEQAPAERRPSVVFAGRSNVGKSSLLNAVTGRRGLARTSSTPGRTQEIVFFNIDDRAWFIDLPGYGYAKVPLAIKRRWQPMMARFFAEARDLRLTVLLIDARRTPGEEELQLCAMLQEREIPYIFAVTKVDKLTRAELAKSLRKLQTALDLESDDALIPVSAQTGAGIGDLQAVIREVIAQPVRPGDGDDARPPRTAQQDDADAEDDNAAVDADTDEHDDIVHRQLPADADDEDDADVDRGGHRRPSNDDTFFTG